MNHKIEPKFKLSMINFNPKMMFVQIISLTLLTRVHTPTPTSSATVSRHLSKIGGFKAQFVITSGFLSPIKSGIHYIAENCIYKVTINTINPNMGMFLIVCLYVYYCWRSSYQKEEGWDPINWFNPVTFLCLFQARTWIYNVICCSLFMDQCEEERVVDIDGIVNRHGLNFLFVTSHRQLLPVTIKDLCTLYFIK